MYMTWWQWYYYDELEIHEAREQIELLESRMLKICEDKEKRQASGKEKKEKLKRLKQSIYALKYTYSINDIGNDLDKFIDGDNNIL